MMRQRPQHAGKHRVDVEHTKVQEDCYLKYVNLSSGMKFRTLIIDYCNTMPD